MTTPSRVLEHRSVAAQAADAIRDMIAAGELVPGQALPAERQLATLLEISRPTLRQAISALTATNVLQSRHGGGTYVTALTPELLVEPVSFLLKVNGGSDRALLEVRSVLAAHAARTACAAATADDLTRLAADLDRCADQLPDPAAFTAADVRFHQAYVDLVGNPVYAALHRSVAELSRPGRLTAAADPAGRRALLNADRRILTAITARRPDRATEAVDAYRTAADTLLPPQP